MKRLICILLVFLILLCCIITVHADDVRIEVKKQLEQRFEDYLLSLSDCYPSYYFQSDSNWCRFEEGYHYFAPGNETDMPDYILIEGGFNLVQAASCYEALDTYIIVQNNIYAPEPMGMYLYSVSDEKFYGLSSPEVDPVVTNAVIQEYLLPNHQQIIKRIGDADGDDDLNILDATMIQRIIAGISETQASDALPEIGFPTDLACVSDMDRDGERTILDATAIQRALVGLE